MSIAQLSRSATTVVRARCVANEVMWDAGEIWTRSTFALEELWGGTELEQQFAIRLLGGTFGNVTSRVSGVPRFLPGEEVVLFLEPTTRGHLSIVSWKQGTFRVSHNRGTGEETVTEDTASMETYNATSHRFEQSGIRRMPIATFHEQVNAALSLVMVQPAREK